MKNTYSCQCCLQAKPVDQVGNRIRDYLRVFATITSALLTDVWDDSCDLLGFTRVAGLEANNRCKTQTAGNTVRDGVSGSNCMPNAVAEANSAAE